MVGTAEIVVRNALQILKFLVKTIGPNLLSELHFSPHLQQQIK